MPLTDTRTARIDVDHADLGDDAYHEWVHLGHYEWRTVNGAARHGSYRWLRVVCNNTACGGIAWVSGDAIDQHATTLIDAERAGR